MSHDSDGISQNVSGSQVYGGIQATQGNNNHQTIKSHTTVASEKQLTHLKVVQMLKQLEQLIEGDSELPEADKEKSLRFLGAAKEEAQAKEPDKQLTAGNLKRMAETLKTASKIVGASKSLWENAKPILMQLAGWLGVAKNFFGF